MSPVAPVAGKAPFQALIDFLSARHAAVMDCEAQAEKALNEGNETSYRALMERKADLLAVLDEQASPLYAALPTAQRDFAQSRLRAFAEGARTAKRLSSVFYMSALLYPDTHRKGEPDNLELFLREVRSWRDSEKG